MSLNSNEFILLTSEQVFGEQRIDAIKQLDSDCTLTDFAILLGGRVEDESHTSEGNYLEGDTTWCHSPSSYTHEEIDEVLGCSKVKRRNN
ncbi:MAG: hypothetical protein IKF82_03780 [Bacilli bacterium]|nr:hypothetical protein [Bacilli bacterium]